jgi:hypothetical protein
MAVDSFLGSFGRFSVAILASAALMASEHHGTVKSGGLPVPGATVTATQATQKLVTTTDELGAYEFPDLADGVWTIQIQMLGFDTLTREVGIAPDAPNPEWTLKLLTLGAVRQALAPTSSAAAPSPSAPTPQEPEARHAAQAPAGPGPDTPGFGRGPGGRGAGGRGGNAAASSGPAATANGNGRPSLRQAAGQNGFQRVGVNQSADAEADTNAATDGAAAMLAGPADANQSSDAFVVNGSLSTGLDMPQQNDWMVFGGRGGMGFGPGGPGGIPGAGMDGMMAMNPGDGPPAAQAAGPAGRGGGPGGPGGPGGFGGPGGRGGGGGFAFGGGGRGGRGGGPGGPGGRGGPNRRVAFGNGRRDRRMQYNANVALILDNSALDARPYSLTGQNTAKAAYSHFRSTGMVGGPLKIPHLLTGQKTFFTVNYQLARNRNATTSTTLMPTADERAGDFSNALNALTGKPVVIYDPTSGMPFPGNRIPQERISDQAAGKNGLLNFYPLPNFAGNNRYNYQIPRVGVGNQTNVNSRISQTINARNQIAGTFAYQSGNNVNPNVFNFIDTTQMTGINTGLNWSYHFTTRIISNLRYNFSRSATTTNPFFANVQNVSGDAGIQGNYQAPDFWGPPGLSFSSGFAGLSDGAKQLNHNNTNQLGDSVLWVHGSHNITFGADFRRLDFNQLAQQNARGTFGFTGGLTSNIQPNGVAVTGTGFDFADFLLGLPDTSSIAYAPGGADKYFRASWADAYITDDWRVSTRLSLNVGLRWDFQAPVTEKYNRLVNLEIGQNFATATPVCGVISAGSTCTLASTAGFPDSLIRPNYHEFQPRLGFAWRPDAKGRMVVRGGYGIYYNTSVYQPLANLMSQQAPLSVSVTQPNSPAVLPLFTMANGFGTPLLNPTATPQTFGLDPNFHIGYVHYWQLSLQRNLPWALVATLTYNGNKGTHQVQQFLPNTVPTGAPASGFPQGFAYETSNANSHYNAGIAQLQRRFRSGFSGNAVYVYSRAIDDSQSLGGRGGGGGGTAYAQNWLDLDAERSVSAFNHTHNLNLNMQYSTGMGARGGALIRGWKGVLAKNWTVATGITIGSGLPETPVVAARITTGTGLTGTTRADYLGGSLAAVVPGYGFNTAVFGAPPAGQWGNAGRAVITGPSQFGLNASASRTFRIGERHSSDLRFDATNALNHVVFSSWNASVGSTQFGLPTGANGMRTLQATLRFRF